MFKWAALVMLLVAFVVAASNSGQRMEPILQAITTIQRCVRVAQCGLVLFLIVFSRYLGVSWRQQSFGIALGLGGAAAVELGTLALYAGGPISQVTVHVFNLLAYNLAIVVWFSYVFRESPARVAEASLFAPNRWERSLSDLQTPANGDSLIPMFESMVDRAFSARRWTTRRRKAAAAAGSGTDGAGHDSSYSFAAPHSPHSIDLPRPLARRSRFPVITFNNLANISTKQAGYIVKYDLRLPS